MILKELLMILTELMMIFKELLIIFKEKWIMDDFKRMIPPVYELLPFSLDQVCLQSPARAVFVDERIEICKQKDEIKTKDIIWKDEWKIVFGDEKYQV